MLYQDLLLGLLLVFLGGMVFLVGYHAAFLYALSRTKYVDELGFFEAFFLTIKLFFELSLALVIAFFAMMFGAVLGGDIDQYYL
jgi:hypothetical protein